MMRIKIPQLAYEEQMSKLKFSLIGRLNFRYLSMNDVRSFVKDSWVLLGTVELKTLGKGFILFIFDLESDMLMIWRRGPSRIGGQLLRFQRWSPDFKVDKQQMSHRLIWIRFPGLPQEYWHDDILFSIANAVGRPVAIDRKTKTLFYGHCARVCVDVDETQPRVSEVLMEREQPGSAELFLFKQSVVFEDPPSRCGDCKKYGHRSKNCPTHH
ncbi:uncharacterized protein LOC122650562 [Telopea speciosissima]|uniref:uncharacterized protein LOC122650562 n=1 Tax=Telopea speciosissima TaxID=54955 RepID=UPI001CC61CA5|nr:uncharacterized protein LOC122650562 [Telopea speciosissima]